jgi:hypothetical protein
MHASNRTGITAVRIELNPHTVHGRMPLPRREPWASAAYGHVPARTARTRLIIRNAGWALKGGAVRRRRAARNEPADAHAFSLE